MGFSNPAALMSQIWLQMDELVRLREQLNSSGQLAGMRLTYMPFIIKVCCRRQLRVICASYRPGVEQSCTHDIACVFQAAAISLQKFPTINSSLSADGASLIQHTRTNIGIAVATPYGLAVPNIKDVQVNCLPWPISCMG
jgi:pyruvate/2-oxoglutarate dehydrogenase complex dihydrolipoamide acyltransferase (E2) component